MVSADVASVSESRSTIGRRWNRLGLSDDLGSLSSEFRAVSASTLAVAVAAAGGLVASRRLAGSMNSGLTAGSMAVTVLALLACVIACDWMARQAGRRAGSAGGLRSRLLCRAGLLLCVWGVSGSATPAALWIALASAITTVVTITPRHRLANLRGKLQKSGMPHGWLPRVWQPQPTSVTHCRQEETCSGDGFIQQQVRRRTVAGGESIRGTVVVSFRAGDRLAVAHVGFCPPLREMPAVQLSTAYDEVDAAVTPGEILPWGIRVECRLEEAAEDPFDIPIDFIATSTQRAR